VIVETAQLDELSGRVAMVDGGFDPLHAGHVAYFREAGALGAPVLCNLAPDEWVARKHPPLLPQAERAQVVDAIRFVDYVHVAAGPTVDTLRRLRPCYYVKGADWQSRLPEEESAACTELGIEIVYLDTVLASSTDLVERFAQALASARTGS
jgi:cytidyltransferase-like protein